MKFQSLLLLPFLMYLPLAYASDHSTDTAISKDDVLNAQTQWRDAIIAIGEAYQAQGECKQDCQNLAANTVDTLYAYDEGTVLFKPTKAAAEQFRGTKEAAISYFVGGEVAEDKGFALQPWSNVEFENTGIITEGDSALVMGNYYFTDANCKSGDKTKVEFTFGYKKTADGTLLINLHHSSIPYKPH